MNVLIVDDQPNLARVTAVALRLLDCQTVVARTTADATRLLAAEQIDLVLLDVNLAGESGMEFLSLLTAQATLIPIVIFTAQTKDEVAAEALRRGAFDCLVKPFSVDDLRALLARIDQHRRQPVSTPNGSTPPAPP